MGKSHARKRSSSGNSCKEMVLMDSNNKKNIHVPSKIGIEVTTTDGLLSTESCPSTMESCTETQQQQQQQQLLQIREWMRILLKAGSEGCCGQPSGSVILHQAENFPLLVAFLSKAQVLDQEIKMGIPTGGNDGDLPSSSMAAASLQLPLDSISPSPSSVSSCMSLQEQLLLERDLESQYTALHWAIYRADLASLLFLLKHAAGSSERLLTTNNHNSNKHNLIGMSSSVSRTSAMTTSPIRPMSLLEYTPETSPTTPGSSDPSNTPSSSSSSSPLLLWQGMVSALDGEGFTPGQLLASLQRSELRACRAFLQSKRRTGAAVNPDRAVQNPSSSFDLAAAAIAMADHQDADSELNLLHQYMNVLSSSSSLLSRRQRTHLISRQHEDNGDDPSSEEEDMDNEENMMVSPTAVFDDPSTSTETQYGCEVLTFGRAHHCALGVGTEGATTTTKTKALDSTKTTSSTSTTTTTFRPQRVQAFAQSEVGRELGAVGVAAATHHTLVLNKAGQVFAFGLNKGGRLGIGNHERHSPLPTLVCFPHNRCRVIAIAAAENHSLAVLEGGQTYAWGSNRFGQLGISMNNTNKTSAAATTKKNTPAKARSTPANSSKPASSPVTPPSSSSCALVPRRVDDLKDVIVCAVAAGERHSVALSSSGDVYVWGDNSSGQLGVPPRHGGNTHIAAGNSGPKAQKHSHVSSSSSHNPVQRVQHPTISAKTAVAIAASEYTTLALTLPSQDGKSLPVNGIYSWGQGNHVPSKVHLPQHYQQQETGGSSSRQRRRSRSHSWNEDDASSGLRHERLISPVAIACAKYHNVAITENGLVYTWGFHSETLGNATDGKVATTSTSGGGGSCSRSTSTTSRCWRGTTPQLVTGMLPENGGGYAVAVSTSENHTAIVADTGALYTWGATHGPSILGHEGVRWQPNPKKVPGLYRAVAVAAAKEHFVVLAGTSFPPLPTIKPCTSPAIQRITKSSILTSSLRNKGSEEEDKKPCSRSFKSSIPSLEELAAQQVTKYVDLFNIWPILITAERIQNETLIQYCQEFCRMNLDGVLNVGQRRVMDQYLMEKLQMLDGSGTANAYDTEYERREARDTFWHPIIRDFCNSCSSNNITASASPATKDWIRTCTNLMQSLPGQVFLRKVWKLHRRKADEERRIIGLTRNSSQGEGNQKTITAKENAASTTKLVVPGSVRSRGVSFGEAQVVTLSSKGSPRCLELISNLFGDDTCEKSVKTNTAEDQKLWIEERQRGLLKEIRALRKRLNQIYKLVELEKNNGEEGSGISSLSSEQREKVARRHLLEIDLKLLEPALSKVNSKLEELYLQCNQVSNTEQSETCATKNTIVETDNSISTEKISAFRCDLCKVSCSDESSYSLHMNGRKHRNRLAQAEQEEREHKAALVVAEQHQKELSRQLSTPDSEPLDRRNSQTKPTSNPWKKNAPLSPTPQPFFKLPPPPHAVPATLATQTGTASAVPTPQEKTAPTRSLVDIMAAEEESKRKSALKTGKANNKKATSRLKAPPNIRPLTAPTAVATSDGKVTPSVEMKSLLSAPTCALATPMLAAKTKSSTGEPSIKHSFPETGETSLHFKVDALPVMDAPPWSTAPVAPVPAHYEAIPTHQCKTGNSSIFSTESSNSSGHMLSDFISGGPPSLARRMTPSTDLLNEENSKAHRPVTGKHSAWRPKAAVGLASNANLSLSSKKLVQIQDEELAFKEKQDAACGEAQAVWFVGRRERAGSFKEIQKSAEQERDHDLFVQEQYRIEQMIQEERQQQEKVENNRKKSQKRKQKQHQHRSRNGGGRGGGRGSNQTNSTSQTKGKDDKKPG